MCAVPWRFFFLFHSMRIFNPMRSKHTIKNMCKNIECFWEFCMDWYFQNERQHFLWLDGSSRAKQSQTEYLYSLVFRRWIDDKTKIFSKMISMKNDLKNRFWRGSTVCCASSLHINIYVGYFKKFLMKFLVHSPNGFHWFENKKRSAKWFHSFKSIAIEWWVYALSNEGKNILITVHMFYYKC